MAIVREAEYDLVLIIRPANGNYGAERIMFAAGSFLEIAPILGKFHDLAQAVKADEAADDHG